MNEYISIWWICTLLEIVGCHPPPSPNTYLYINIYRSRSREINHITKSSFQCDIQRNKKQKHTASLISTGVRKISGKGGSYIYTFICKYDKLYDDIFTECTQKFIQDNLKTPLAAAWHWNKPQTVPRQKCPWSVLYSIATLLIARFMGPTWGPPEAEKTQVDPMLAPWILLSGTPNKARTLFCQLKQNPCLVTENYWVNLLVSP